MCSTIHQQVTGLNKHVIVRCSTFYLEYSTLDARFASCLGFRWKSNKHELRWKIIEALILSKNSLSWLRLDQCDQHQKWHLSIWTTTSNSQGSWKRVRRRWFSRRDDLSSDCNCLTSASLSAAWKSLIWIKVSRGAVSQVGGDQGWGD